MLPARTPSLRLLDTISALAFLVIVCGIGWGLVGSIAIVVMRWLTGWPA